jgi:flagellar biosynthesis/type III secretory pathway protein FliH
MTTQVFAGGGLRKKLEIAHMNGYREGFEDGYNTGFEDALKVRVREYVAEALAAMEISRGRD